MEVGMVSGIRDMIVAKEVHKWFDRLHVLKGVSLTVKSGEVVVVFGPSG